MNEWLTITSTTSSSKSVIRISAIDSVRLQPVIDQEGTHIAIKNVITGELEPAWQVLVMTKVGGHQINFTDEEKALSEFTRIHDEVQQLALKLNKGLN